MDPARFDPTIALFAWIHPIFIGATLLGALVVYTTGLRLREARTGKGRRTIRPGTRKLHTRLARPIALLLIGGFATGLVSALILRDWPVLSTFHGRVGLGAVIAFSVGAFVGLRLDAGRTRRATLHGLLGLLGMALGLIAAVAGIELLP